MILTVTPNTALDRCCSWTISPLARRCAPATLADGMGGKGAVTSWVLGQLGTPSLATGFVGGRDGPPHGGDAARGGRADRFPAGGGGDAHDLCGGAQRGHPCLYYPRAYAPGQKTHIVSSSTYRTCYGTPICCTVQGTLPPGLPVNWYGA